MFKDFIPWMDNIYIEGKYGWFVSGNDNALFRLDMESKTYELVAILPKDNSDIFRQNPRCLKYKNRIYCLPDCGNVIWVYILEEDKFINIELYNPHNERLSISHYIVIESSLFILSDGLKKIFEINFNQEAIAEEYDFAKEIDEISGSTVLGNSIYILCNNLSKVCEINLKTKMTETYKMPKIEDTLNTISFDGNNFWLSGFRKKIYIWKKNEDTVRVLNKFPNVFKILGKNEQNDEKFTLKINGYDIPLFRYSLIIDNKILFIPFLIDKIISCDIDTKKIQCIDIKNESEELNDIKQRAIWAKYLLEYVRSNRYVGLYSLKNRCILEVDMEKMVINYAMYKPAYLSESMLKKLRTMNLLHLEEGNAFHRFIYNGLLRRNTGKILNDNDEENIGKLIYSLLEEDV